jgi:hypothetical protein
MQPVLVAYAWFESYCSTSEGRKVKLTTRLHELYGKY